MFTSTAQVSVALEVRSESESVFSTEGTSDHNLATPEHRLWSAVVCAIVADYDRTLRKIASFKNPKRHLRFTLEAIRKEAASPFIGDVCEHLGVAHSRMLKRLDALEVQHNLAQAQFENT